nr:zinc finger, CCHC-type [Tanacetum cinerariifolium]
MLKELKTLFAQQAEHKLLQTTRDFHSCRQEEGQSVSSHVLKMKGYIDNLKHLGHPVILGLGVSLILIDLRKEYDGFVQSYNMHSMGKTVNELHAMLKLHEQTLTLPKSNAPALHAIRAGKVQKEELSQYLAELMKKKKNAASGAGGLVIFVIELNTILNRSWIYDTGCGTHICYTTQGLRASRKLKPGALSLYVGNGQRKAVEAIGAFYLCLPSGLEIVLNNCHYAPSITRGVISVSNVCGPFKIMSRQGASYFVTFTDDFSRYGYVYLLKHKHEVFENFKVFQKEVENQPGKTIKSLRSDCGGEYISQKFLDHLKDHGIIAHHTPPYTSQHN